MHHPPPHTLTPTPFHTPNASGTFDLSYTVQDPVTGQNTTAFVTITVPSPNAPLARDDYYTCVAGQACSPPTSVLANDTSPTGGTITFVGISSPPSPGGSLVFKPDGTFTFTPSPM